MPISTRAGRNWALHAAADRLTSSCGRKVRELFTTAARLAPEDPEPLILLYLTFGANRQEATREAVAGLYRARELAPQDHNLRILAAHQYLTDGNVDQARSMLALLAADPLAGEMGPRMATVLRKLEQSGKIAALTAFSQADLLQAIASF